jgi:hypothetical protein
VEAFASASLLSSVDSLPFIPFNRKPAGYFASRGPETKLDLVCYLTLIKMMAKVYSAIDSISTSARISMF